MNDFPAFLHETYSWLKSHDVLAAWFQGIGSVLALVVAFMVAGQQSRAARRAAERERQIRGRALAFLIIGELKNMRSSLADSGTAYVNSRLLGPALASRLDQLYLLGDAGMAILECLALADEDWLVFYEDNPPQMPFDQRPSRKRALAACDKAVQLAERVMAGADTRHGVLPSGR